MWEQGRKEVLNRSPITGPMLASLLFIVGTIGQSTDKEDKAKRGHSVGSGRAEI